MARVQDSHPAEMASSSPEMAASYNIDSAGINQDPLRDCHLTSALIRRGSLLTAILWNTPYEFTPESIPGPPNSRVGDGDSDGDSDTAALPRPALPFLDQVDVPTAEETGPSHPERRKGSFAADVRRPGEDGSRLHGRVAATGNDNPVNAMVSPTAGEQSCSANEHEEQAEEERARALLAPSMTSRPVRPRLVRSTWQRASALGMMRFLSDKEAAIRGNGTVDSARTTNPSATGIVSSANERLSQGPGILSIQEYVQGIGAALEDLKVMRLDVQRKMNSRLPESSSAICEASSSNSERGVSLHARNLAWLREAGFGGPRTPPGAEATSSEAENPFSDVHAISHEPPASAPIVTHLLRPGYGTRVFFGDRVYSYDDDLWYDSMPTPTAEELDWDRHFLGLESETIDVVERACAPWRIISEWHNGPMTWEPACDSRFRKRDPGSAGDSKSELKKDVSALLDFEFPQRPQTPPYLHFPQVAWLSSNLASSIPDTDWGQTHVPEADSGDEADSEDVYDSDAGIVIDAVEFANTRAVVGGESHAASDTEPGPTSALAFTPDEGGECEELGALQDESPSSDEES